MYGSVRPNANNAYSQSALYSDHPLYGEVKDTGRVWNTSRLAIALCLVILLSFYSVGRESMETPITISPPDLVSSAESTMAIERQQKNVNIMLLMLDQARPDAFSITGTSSAAHTPNIDRIAMEGVRFTNAYSSTPMCTPARQALMTGKKPWSHGMRGYATSLVPEKYMGSWVGLPRLLADNGYYTAVIGKSHFAYNATTLQWWDHGFMEQYVHEGGLACDFSLKGSDFVLLDSYDAYFNMSCPECGDPLATHPRDEENGWWGSPYVYNESLHPTSWTSQLAVQWLTNWTAEPRENPFFLKVSFLRPHSPYDPPQRWYDYMEARVDELPLPAYSDSRWDHRFGHAGSLCNMSNAATYCGNPGEAAVLQSRVAYYGSLAFVDESFGDIWDKLESTGLIESTFILFVADHGDSLGDHHLWRKGYWTEQVASIPFYLRWPESLQNRIKAARNITRHEVVEIRDILPTFIDAANLTLTANQTAEIDGSSVLTLLNGNSSIDSTWRKWIDMEFASCGFNNSMNWNALTDGKIKYVYSLYDGSDYLFDLKNDPYEKTDLAAMASWNNTLHLWRQRLTTQFEDEGRNSYYLDGTKLATIGEKCWETKFMGGYPCGKKQCSNY